MKLKQGFIMREIAGEIVVVPSGDELKLNMMITLNETGKLLWQRLEVGADIDELVQAMLAASWSRDLGSTRFGRTQLQW